MAAHSSRVLMSIQNFVWLKMEVPTRNPKPETRHFSSWTEIRTLKPEMFRTETQDLKREMNGQVLDFEGPPVAAPKAVVDDDDNLDDEEDA